MNRYNASSFDLPYLPNKRKHMTLGSTCEPPLYSGAVKKNSWTAGNSYGQNRPASELAKQVPPTPPNVNRWAESLARLESGWQRIDHPDEAERPANWGWFKVNKSMVMQLEILTSNVRAAFQVCNAADGRLISTQEYVQIAGLTGYVVEVANLYHRYGYPLKEFEAEFQDLLAELYNETKGDIEWDDAPGYKPLHHLLHRLETITAPDLSGAGAATKEGGDVLFGLPPPEGISDKARISRDIREAAGSLRRLTDAKTVMEKFPYSYGIGSTVGASGDATAGETKIGFRNVPAKTYINAKVMVILAKHRHVFTFSQSQFLEIGEPARGPWPGASVAIVIYRNSTLRQKQALSVMNARKILAPTAPAAEEGGAFFVDVAEVLQDIYGPPEPTWNAEDVGHGNTTPRGQPDGNGNLYAAAGPPVDVMAAALAAAAAAGNVEQPPMNTAHQPLGPTQNGQTAGPSGSAEAPNTSQRSKRNTKKAPIPPVVQIDESDTTDVVGDINQFLNEPSSAELYRQRMKKN